MPEELQKPLVVAEALVGRQGTQESRASGQLGAGRTEVETPGAAAPQLSPVPIAVTAIAVAPKMAVFALVRIAQGAAIEPRRLPIELPHQNEQASLYAQVQSAWVGCQEQEQPVARWEDHQQYPAGSPGEWR